MNLTIFDLKEKYKDFWYIVFDDKTPEGIEDIITKDWSNGIKFFIGQPNTPWFNTIAVTNKEDIDLIRLVYHVKVYDQGHTITGIEGRPV